MAKRMIKTPLPTPKADTPIARRSALAMIGATAAVPFLQAGAAFAGSDSLEDTVVSHVRSLAQGRNVTLRLLLPQGSSGNLTPVIAEFQKRTGVSVAAAETSFEDINTDLMLDAMSQSQKYDVALPATFALPDLVSAGAIRPINDYVEKYEPAGFRDDILFGVGDSFDGKTYGFQTDGDAYMMFYNKRMLDDEALQSDYANLYGTPLFQPRTWNELDRQMAFFNRPDQGQWGGLMFRTPGYLAWEWWVRFHAKGYWPFSAEMEPQIASDAGVEALEDMILASEHMHPDAKTLGLFANWERYAQGDIFCNIGWGGSQKFWNSPNSKMRGNMIFGATPGGVVDGGLLVTPYFNWGWDYVVTSNSAAPEISYLFALFASTPRISTLAVRQSDGFFDPYRPEHYEDAGIQSAYSREFLEVHRKSLENAIPDLYLKNQSEYFRSLGEWLHRALIGDLSPKDALDRAQIRWQLITDSSGKASQKDRWNKLRGKYPPRTRERLKDVA